MNITAVTIDLPRTPSGKLLAYAHVELDRVFVFHDAKVIEGNRGLFVACPDRVLMDACPGCGRKNALEARWCNWCGFEMGEPREVLDKHGKRITRSPVAHPLTNGFREKLEIAVIAAYMAEVENRL